MSKHSLRAKMRMLDKIKIQLPNPDLITITHRRLGFRILILGFNHKTVVLS